MLTQAFVTCQYCVCVLRMLLEGSDLTADHWTVWGIFYTLVSMGLGLLVTRVFKLPSWVTPALCFNNTTSLPLLLIESLETTGILEKLILSDKDSSAAALLRAKSYLLINSLVGNSMTFALGPKLLDGEDSSEHEEGEGSTQKQGNGHLPQPLEDSSYSGRPGSEQIEERNDEQTRDENQESSSAEQAHEQTSLLPGPVLRQYRYIEGASYDKGKKQWKKLPSWLHSFLDFFYSFLNAPLIGAIIAAILGLTPPLHKAFFGDPQKGGIFTAWLTDSISKIGGLFATLQVVVVGVKLSSSLRKFKRGEDSGRVSWVPAAFVLFIRFIIWPA